MAITKSLASPISQPSIDKAKLILIMVDPVAKSMSVQLGVGFEADGAFSLKTVSNFIISGEDYDALLATAGDPEKSVGEALEGAIWQKLVDLGAVALDGMLAAKKIEKAGPAMPGLPEMPSFEPPK